MLVCCWLANSAALRAICLRSHTSVDRSGPKTLGHVTSALHLGEPQLELIRADAAALVEEFK